MTLDSLGNDSLRSYHADHNVQLQSIIQVQNNRSYGRSSTEPLPPPEALLPIDVLEALNRGDLDGAVKKLQESEKATDDISLMWFFTVLSRLRLSFSVAFAWPQQFIMKHVGHHAKEKVKKEADFVKKTPEEKRAEIRKEADKLRGVKNSEEANKTGVSSNEVDVGVGEEKIEPGSLEWQNEVLRISQMARVAKSIGTPNLMHTILDILLKTLHLSRAADQAIEATKKMEMRIENAKKAIEAVWTKITESLASIISPVASTLLSAADIIRKQATNAVEKISKRIKPVQEIIQKKAVEIVEILTPPIKKIIEPMKKTLKATFERIHDASESVKKVVERVVEKAEGTAAAIKTLVTTTVPQTITHGIAWVYHLSPGAFDGIGNGLMRMVKTAITVASWLGSKSQQAMLFVWKNTIKVAKAIKDMIVATSHLVLKFLNWLRRIIIAFFKKSYQMTRAFVKWTILMIKASPRAVKNAIFDLFHLSKSATERLAARLEKQTKRS